MKLLKKIIRFFIDSLFPIECLGCGKKDVWVCNDCLYKIKLKEDFPCVVCGAPTYFGKTHDRCFKKTHLDGMLCATDYRDEFTRELIRVFKYKYVLDLGRYLGWVMARFVKCNKGGQTFARLQDEHKPILIPIPLHSRRLRERGFNQAEILAREFGKYFEWEIATDILKRTRYTTAQMGLKSRDRLENIKNAFEIDAKLRKECETTKMRKPVKPENDMQIKNRTVILVDDVLTTGATTGEAARVLKMGGAREVWVVCLAKD